VQEKLLVNAEALQKEVQRAGQFGPCQYRNTWAVQEAKTQSI